MPDKLLGALVRDKQTGYEGMVTARLDFHTGCSHYLVESVELRDDGSMVTPYEFDPQRLLLLSKPAKVWDIQEPELQLWAKVHDYVTGFSGFVSAVRTSCYCPPQICIEPDKTRSDGDLNKPQWFFEDRVVLDEDLEEEPKKNDEPDLVAPWGYKLDGTPKKKPGGPSPYSADTSIR